ncbi:hypothetical protein BKA70DRAFT_1328817 [Coprinopsis sp. MPI-PUGE-AT-0042]|nr:hypothetical protein BKA70DRAFT_1328817 [Coprinopsis sp. MPI-PUGE-AT-0042]
MANPPPPRQVVIDDLDPLVRFDGGGWFTVNDPKESFGNFGPTYLSTLHGTNSSAQLSFTFDGSSVTLWGSNNPRNESGIIDPTWDCLIDNVDVGATDPFPFAENNWAFCDWKGTPGEHTLTVRANSQGQTFWVDRVEYVPSPTANVAGGSVISVSHADNAIKLGEGWGALGGTANFTTSRGATAEVEFVGTRLSWWGFTPGEFSKAPTTAAYAIDGGPSTSFVLRGLADNQGTTYNQKYFETPLLTAGPHKVLVVYQGNGQTTPLSLTNLLIEGGNFTSPLPGDPSIFAPTSSSSSTPPESSGTGLAIIAATIIVAFLILRRRKRAEAGMHAVPYGSSHDKGGPNNNHVHTTPIYAANHHEPSLGQGLAPNRAHRPMPSGSTGQWTYDPPSSLGHHRQPVGAGSPPLLDQNQSPNHSHNNSSQGYFHSPQNSTINTSSAGANISHSNLGGGKGQIVALEARNQAHGDSGYGGSGVRMDAQGNMIEVPPLYTVQ